MVKDIEIVKSFVYVSLEEEEELIFYRWLIIMFCKKEFFLFFENFVLGFYIIGVMFFYVGIYYIFFYWSKILVYVMILVNYLGMLMVKDNERVFEEFKDVVDYFFFYNRKILNRVDDSVIRFVDGKRVVIRCFCGFVLFLIEIFFEYNGLVVGVEFMNVFGVVKNGKVYLS